MIFSNLQSQHYKQWNSESLRISLCFVSILGHEHTETTEFQNKHWLWKRKKEHAAEILFKLCKPDYVKTIEKIVKDQDVIC